MSYLSCWLNYKLISDHETSPVTLFIEEQNDTPVLLNAIQELKTGMEGLYHRKIKVTDQTDATIIMHTDSEIKPEGYRIKAGDQKSEISYADETGMLYGVFSLLRVLQTLNVRKIEELEAESDKAPSNPLRMLNHWDNLDGSIERGYAGNSFFFSDKEILVNERTVFYARMIASVGINGVVINNVNVDDDATKLITDEYYEKVGRIAEIFSSYGIRLFLSINYASPMVLSGVSSADPLDQKVCDWWEQKAAEIYSRIPSLGGFLVKADSEGRPGPFTYERTHADGANMLAKAVRPYGGLIIWRCFVYNCKQDWRDNTIDRARAGYDNFKPLDGQFLENVILQIKNGPMDFQVREPVSPLFGAMKQTNMMLEFQIAQEYTGQQKHVCYLLPWFRQVLDFDLHTDQKPSCLKDIVSGCTYAQTNCGIAAVANTGNDENWTGHDLAAANLYGFGRLAYDTSVDAYEIAKEWMIQTFGAQEEIIQHIGHILMTSWKTYEDYTAPLGVGWMVNPNNHFGPNVDGYEYDRWGTYHKSDCKGMGVNRSSTGTGFCMQYNEPLCNIYEHMESCPDELLLFFHHVPYTYCLKTGETVIQHIYNTHFEGAESAAAYLNELIFCKDYMDKDTYNRIQERLAFQKEHAKEWRDRINTYYHRMSGIEDDLGRKIYD